MLTKTLSEAKKKQRNILIKAMNNDIGSIDSSKDSWNPAQISERAKDISYIRSLVDTWNPAQLNEALKMLDLPVIDTWNPAQIEEQRRNLVFYLAERTLTGNPITLKILGNLTPGVTGLKVTMTPIQDLNGYDHPWAGGAGKNKLPNTQNTEAKNGVTLTKNTDGTYTVTGTATANSYFIIGRVNIPEGTYRLSGCPTGGGDSSYRLYFESPISVDDTGDGVTFTISENTACNGVIFIVNGYACPTNGLIFEPMCCLSSQSQEFAPYSNICPISGRTEVSVTRTAGEDVETHTHQYGQEVYSGVDNFVDGGLPSDMAIIDLGTLSWNYNDQVSVFYARISGKKEGRINILSDMYKVVDKRYQDLLDGEVAGVINAPGQNDYINLKDLRYDNVSDLTTGVTGSKLCYELATPTTIETSAEEITLLKGTNVLSTDGDSIELKYKQNF